MALNFVQSELPLCGRGHVPCSRLAPKILRILRESLKKGTCPLPQRGFDLKALRNCLTRFKLRSCFTNFKFRSYPIRLKFKSYLTRFKFRSCLNRFKLSKFKLLKYKKSQSPPGVSLLEVMIVITIIVLMITIGVPQFKNRNNQLKSTVRRLLVLGKKTRYKARLTNRPYRLVIDLGTKEDTKQSYWIEEASNPEALADQSRNPLLEAKEEKEKRDSFNEFNQDSNTGNSSEESTSPQKNDFSLAQNILSSPIKWPKDLKITSVELSHQKEAQLQGKAHIYFFPSGFIEEAAIHIQLRETLKWTIFFHPYTGEIDLIKKEMSLQDVK